MITVTGRERQADAVENAFSLGERFKGLLEIRRQACRQDGREPDLKEVLRYVKRFIERARRLSNGVQSGPRIGAE